MIDTGTHPSELLTTRRVADELHVSTETVLRWIRRGDLPALRLPGSSIRVRRDQLEAWLADRQVGHPGEVDR
jgi:excisionase family DNA binding protein